MGSSPTFRSFSSSQLVAVMGCGKSLVYPNRGLMFFVSHFLTSCENSLHSLTRFADDRPSLNETSGRTFTIAASHTWICVVLGGMDSSASCCCLSDESYGKAGRNELPWIPFVPLFHQELLHV